MATFLRRCCPERNENRFYHVHVSPALFEAWSVVVEWGRVGSPGTVRIAHCESLSEADERAQSMVDKKLKRGYQAVCG